MTGQRVDGGSTRWGVFSCPAGCAMSRVPPDRGFGSFSNRIAHQLILEQVVNRSDDSDDAMDFSDRPGEILARHDSHKGAWPHGPRKSTMGRVPEPEIAEFAVNIADGPRR